MKRQRWWTNSGSTKARRTRAIPIASDSNTANLRTGRVRTWPVGSIVLVGIVGLPILWLAAAAVSAGFDPDGGGLAARMLPTALRDTGLLMLSVGLITGVLGLTSAWLVTHFEFPGRRIFAWALVLPLAVPTYLAAYTFVEFFRFTGPVQSALRDRGAGHRRLLVP